MLFFEVSAKTGVNVQQMIYSCIAELTFFQQFDIDNKVKIIEELGKLYLLTLTEAQNNKQKEQNSIYDIVHGGTPSQLNVKDAKKEQTPNKNGCKC